MLLGFIASRYYLPGMEKTFTIRISSTPHCHSLNHLTSSPSTVTSIFLMVASAQLLSYFTLQKTITCVLSFYTPFVIFREANIQLVNYMYYQGCLNPFYRLLKFLLQLKPDCRHNVMPPVNNPY